MGGYRTFGRFGSVGIHSGSNISIYTVLLKFYPEVSKIATNLERVEPLLQEGVSLHQQGRLVEAQIKYENILSLNSQHFDALHLLGVISDQCGDHQRAVDLINRAIAIDPNQPGPYCNVGVALAALNQHHEAIQGYKNAIQLKPDFAQALNNLGVSQTALKMYGEAMLSYTKAIALSPGYSEAYNNMGMAQAACKRYQESIENFERCLALKPDYAFLLGTLIHNKMLICDWSGLELKIDTLIRRVQAREKVSSSFAVLALTSSAAIQRVAAEVWSLEKCRQNTDLGSIGHRSRSKRIRLGYYSSDFYDHATAYLMAGLFEAHDRTKFELFAFSFGDDSNCAMRQRLVASFDSFIDVQAVSDIEVAKISRRMQIDIAIDLKGFTRDNRANIFAYRAAPIQVNYLGYPGTMGTTFMDYIVADETVIPRISQSHYAEKVVYLPHSYQVNDADRRIADWVPRRDELGLPSVGFVFCCFNSSFKITPQTFGSWMRILKLVPNSVLWLLEENTEAVTNLRKEAAAHGVEATRLVFAGRMPLAEHLARHRVADLFLDTLPCNAHTTASDSLWAGLPVLTCMGEAFASRVAGSLLNALGLSELVTSTPEEYEQLAIDLAGSHERLAKIKRKLLDNRLSRPLFDTNQFTKYLETAFEQMHESYAHGLPPTHICIAPQ